MVKEALSDIDWLSRDGSLLVTDVFTGEEVTAIREEITAALEATPEGSQAIRSRAGRIYAARNMLSIFPAALTLWQREPLLSLLRETLGDEFGLVRGLYFDKHPEKSWSLPWHKDLTIAVERNDLPTTEFKNPTTKAGVAHVEASTAVLNQMLTLRIHLDRVTEANGPLLVIPGSHHDGKTPAAGSSDFRAILSAGGDVLAMRPLLSHSSGESHEGTTSHRRILHLEFAGQRELPDGYKWHTFLPPD